MDGSDGFVVGPGKNGALVYYGKYDEKNNQHKLLKRINIGAGIRNDNSIW